MNSLIAGAAAGLFATIPMTIAMKAMHSLLPREERYPLPPRLIVESAVDKSGVEGELGEDDKTHLAVISHFAYGAAMGTLYNASTEAFDLEPNIARGVSYGLGVWCLSYLGLLPAAGLLTPATEHPARRNALMIASHIVWGAALGWAGRELYVRDGESGGGASAGP